MRTLLVSALCLCAAWAPALAAAQPADLSSITAAVAASEPVEVPVAPPAPLVERPTTAPRHGHAVWTSGYWRWQNDHHEWVPGRWQEPPSPNMSWEAPHWIPRGDQWVMSPPSWRAAEPRFVAQPRAAVVEPHHRRHHRARDASR